MAKQKRQKKASKETPLEVQATPVDIQHQTWNLDSVWITGLAGIATTFLCAIWFQQAKVLNIGLTVWGNVITRDQHISILIALFIICAVMFVVELFRQIRYNQRIHTPFLIRDPHVSAGQHFTFFGHSLAVYLQNLFLLWLLTYFYRYASEFGYRNNHPFYQPWFKLLDMVWMAYFWAGLPYILVTRAFKHDVKADRQGTDFLVAQIFLLIISYIPLFKEHRPTLDRDLKTAFHSLILKMFFVPIMTVFFVDQFPHFVNNINYLLEGLPNSLGNAQFELGRFNADLTNILTNTFFTLHVGIAWSAYFLTSRWIHNTNKSLDPTLFGWLICLLCYPPFLHLLVTKFFKAPAGEHMVGFTDIMFNTSGQWMITFLTLAATSFYLCYTLSTMYLGIHFSNLCNRGIQRKGPYSVVRHPAYASKILGWFCIIIPFILYHVFQGHFSYAATYLFGMMVTVALYYLRAAREEVHLNEDPYYQTYKEQVKYRFIPRVL